MELTLAAAARALEAGYFNLVKRGADGSLVLSADRWRLAERTEEALRFVGQAADAPALVLAVADVERATWDRLPRQQVRSQVRFHLRGGGLWTFSGAVHEAALTAED